MKSIEDAFLTLIDENKRVAYNQMLIDTGQIDASILSNKVQKKSTALFDAKNSASIDDLAVRIRKKSAEKEVKRLLNEVLAKDLVSGNDLKRLRKALGIEISEIHMITKISPPVLKMIEDIQFESLPADIYLKNFLRSYAKILQIDAQRIVDGYLKNLSIVKKGD
ncbi:helix-turn-helix domain-containing protein [Thermodesulfobacteriota bacterium]